MRASVNRFEISGRTQIPVKKQNCCDSTPADSSASKGSFHHVRQVATTI